MRRYFKRKPKYVSGKPIPKFIRTSHKIHFGRGTPTRHYNPNFRFRHNPNIPHIPRRLGGIAKRIPFRAGAKAGLAAGTLIAAHHGWMQAGKNSYNLGKIFDKGFDQLRSSKQNQNRMPLAVNGPNYTDSIKCSKSFTRFPTHPTNGKGSYDKTNCSHGNISDKDYTQLSATVAQQVVSVLGNKTFIQPTISGASSNDSLSRYASLFFARRTTTEDVDLGNVLQNMASVVRKPIQMVWQRKEMIFSNINTHGCQVMLVDIIANSDVAQAPFGSSLPNKAADPGALMDFSTSTEGNYTGSGKDINSKNDIEFNVFFCRDLWTYWKKVKVTKFWLEPGEQHIHTTFHRLNWVSDGNNLAQGGLCVKKGVTSTTLLFARGKVVHTITGGVPTFDGVKLDYLVTYNTYCREFNPYQDWFYLDAGSDWAGELGARDTVAGMELEDHTDETGVN